jgi:hypothetical protein
MSRSRLRRFAPTLAACLLLAAPLAAQPVQPAAPPPDSAAVTWGALRAALRVPTPKPDTVLRVDTLLHTDTLVHVDTVTAKPDTVVRTVVRVDTVKAKPDTVTPPPVVIVHVDTVYMPTPAPVTTPITTPITTTPAPTPVVPVDSAPIAAPPVQTPAPVPAPAPAPAADTLRAKFLARWSTWEPQRWKADSSLWNRYTDYYDRADAYYRAAALPEFSASSALYRARGDSIVVSYLRDYVEPNGGGVAPHDTQVEGVYQYMVRMLARGDSLGAAEGARARKDLIAIGKKLWAANGLGTAPVGHYMTPASGEPRIVGRVLHAQYYAWLVDTNATERAAFKAQTDASIAYARAFMAVDGSYPNVVSCNGQINYMVGLLNQVLGKMVEAQWAGLDTVATINQIKAGTQYMWNTQWRPADQSLNYVSVDCSAKSVGTTSSAPDLNMFFAENAGFLFRHTGDSTWRAMGEAALAGDIKGAYLGAPKQFNESFKNGFRYLLQR